MISVLDALPLVVPFFGVLLSSFTLITCCMNRRIQHLSNRVEQLEMNRNSPPQIVIQSTEQVQRPAPPTIVPPPTYPVQQPYPYYQQQQVYPPYPSAPPAYPKGSI